MLHFLLLTSLFFQSDPMRHSALVFQKFSLDEGLSQVTVNVVFQGRDGFLWIGTQDGLNRFDGNEFRVFYPDYEGVTGLSDKDIRAIIQDGEGFLWLGTRYGGVNRFDPKTQLFKPYPYGSGGKGAIQHPHVSSLLLGADGILWLGTLGGGLYRYRPREDHFEQVPAAVASETLRMMEIHDLALAEDDTIWIAAHGGLAYVSEGVWHLYPGGDSPFTALATHPQGGVWAGTEDGRLYLAQREKTLQPMVLKNYPDRVAVNDLLVDQEHRVWLGTNERGLYLFDPSTGQGRTWKHQPGQIHSLSHNNVRTLFRDNNNQLWVGTLGDGLNLLSPRTLFFHNDHAGHLPGQGLSHSVVWSILRDSKDRLWVGTRGGGLNLQKEDGSWIWVKDIQEPTVFALAEDRQARLWVGTQTALLSYRPEDGAVQVFHHDPENEHSLSNNNIISLCFDPQHGLWVGTYGGGINLVDPMTGNIRRVAMPAMPAHEYKNDDILSLISDGGGGIWAGTFAGLNHYDPKTKAFKSYFHDPKNSHSLGRGGVFSILNHRKGLLWIGLDGAGINILNPESGQISRVGPSHGLSNGVIYSLIEDQDGFVWAGSNRGLNRIDPHDFSVVPFSAKEGLQGEEFNIGSAYRDRFGILYFGGVAGMTRFKPGLALLHQPQPSLVFTDFRLFNQSVPIGHADSPLLQSITYTQSLSLDYDQNDVTFAFAALNYGQPERMHYAYKLEPFQNRWIEEGLDQRTAKFTNLPPGRYRLTVRASDRFGVFPPVEAEMRMTVHPSLWQHPFMRLSLVGALVLLVFLVYRVRVVTLKASKRQLILQVREATRELRQANAKLRDLALTDPLTGLRNRRFLTQFFKDDIAFYRRQGAKQEDQVLAFLMLDIDHFKRVNDQYGHDVGDYVLTQVGSMLRQNARQSDLIIRMGGEEFLVVYRCARADSGTILAEKLQKTMRHMDIRMEDGSLLKLTLSIGFASYPFVRQQPDLLDWERVLRFADMAMYLAKVSGRDTWVAFSADSERHYTASRIHEMRLHPYRCFQDGWLRVETGRGEALDLNWPQSQSYDSQKADVATSPKG